MKEGAITIFLQLGTTKKEHLLVFYFTLHLSQGRMILNCDVRQCCLIFEKTKAVEPSDVWSREL
jgi:hypothetical protein